MLQNKKINILLVDDRPENLLVLENILDNPEYTLYKTTSGEEALLKTLEYDFAVILMDVQMPTMSGFEAAQLLRGAEKTKHVPIIFVTAVSKDEKYIFQGYGIGAVDYLFKPIEPEILKSKVKIFAQLYQQKKLLEVQTSQLEQKNSQLTKALTDLKLAQTQLIQAAKMAALGQLIANIAHDINTPAGAIYSAINEIDRDYMVLLEQLIQIAFALDTESRYIYFQACQIVFNSKEKELSTREQRTIARNISKELSSYVDDPLSLSQNLAAVGFTLADIKELKFLFSLPQARQIGKSLAQLGMSQIRVRDIKIAIERIEHLIKALRHYSRVDEGKLVATDLAEDLDNTLIILKNQIKHEIVVHKEYEKVPLLTCHADELNQVWTNLIHNSIQAMQGKGEICLRLKNLQDSIVVEIEDTGPGIAQDVLTKIFDPYFTTKPKGEGTGLGLSICHDIVNRHHGQIEVPFTTSQKTCFRVTLPVTVEYDIS